MEPPSSWPGTMVGEAGLQALPTVRKEQQAAYCGGSPHNCVASHGDGAPEAPEKFQCAEQRASGQFFHLSFLLSSNLYAILSPLAALSLLGSLSECPPFFCPRLVGYGYMCSTNNRNLSVPKYSDYLSVPSPLISRAPCNVGSCSQSRSPELGGQQS